MRTNASLRSTGAADSVGSATSAVLQRKCDCGTHTPGGRECDNCSAKQRGLQGKVSIGASNDPLEQEADRVADRVMSMPVRAPIIPTPLNIQRFSSRSAGRSSEAPASVSEVIGGAGQPLEPSLRRDMEARFGRDFSRVRVHSESAAAQSARDVSARAYAVGNDIVFGGGQFAPASGEGRRLLAHELTHVAQQGAAPAVPPGGGAAACEAGRAGQPDDVTLRRSPDAGVPSDAARPADASPPDAKPAAPPPADGGTQAPPSQTAPGAAAAAQPVCSPKGFARADFLKQPGTSQNDFGLTKLDMAGVTFPEAKTAKARGGVKLQPTAAALPQILSVFTDAGSFIESDVVFFGTNPGDCPGKRYPIKWIISPAGANLIRQGEAEHCEDFQLAFDLSLARFASAVNPLAQSGKVFPSDKAAIAHLKKATGIAPADWRSTFVCLARKTLLRDSGKFHDPRPRTTPPDPGDCKFVTQSIHGGSLPEIGKHPSADIVQGCGEQQPAKKPGASGSSTSANEPAADEAERVA